ncbi:hypothetical protein SEA_RAVENCO17_34 [Gordonia phage RavenCo17]|nr:hypothetical protein SEA_RAVENCO17_34 [Gordonia phage RavenCo17]
MDREVLRAASQAVHSLMRKQAGEPAGTH